LKATVRPPRRVRLERGAVGGRGHYEWTPGAVAGGFTTKLASGTPTIETSKGWKATCTGETGTGTHTGDRQVGDVTIALSGCAHAGEACQSAGASAGEIVSSTLEGSLGIDTAGSNASKQKPEGFAAEAKDVLEASLNGAAYEQAGLTLAMTMIGEEALEVNAVS
jgi:hypothetical protein